MAKGHRIDDWDSSINAIYRDSPASISIVEGDWKQGKTDFALHLAVDELKDCRALVSRVAANIRCFSDAECHIPDTSRVEYIDNFDLLRVFIASAGRKVFIYDEALKNTPSKRAMTTLNAEWLKIVPELSKGGDKSRPGGCHLFVLTQEDSLTEKLFLHPTFKTAKWKKITLHPINPQFRKMVRLSSKLLKRKMTFRNIPATSVNFNPFLSASWSLHPSELQITAFPLDLQVVMEYAKGWSTETIQKAHPEELKDRKDVTRKLRKGMTMVLRQWQVADATRREAVQVPDATTPRL